MTELATTMQQSLKIQRYKYSKYKAETARLDEKLRPNDMLPTTNAFKYK